MREKMIFPDPDSIIIKTIYIINAIMITEISFESEIMIKIIYVLDSVSLHTTLIELFVDT